jgi:hypothetical protein
MLTVCGLLFLSGAYPLGCAWRANRQTSLAHAVAWAWAAWLLWGCVPLVAALDGGTAVNAVRYVAVGVTGCAGVAVLGARRPGVAAWNFVVLGLLAVLLLFLAEGLLVGGELQLSPVRTLFLALVLGVGTLNYLPTRAGAAALVLGVGSALELATLMDGGSVEPFGCYPEVLLLLVPWLAWAGLPHRMADAGEAERMWRDFRDRFGMVWGQRLREQFNRAAANAGLLVELRWSGLGSVSGRELSDADRGASLAILKALTKRFGAEADADSDTVSAAPAEAATPQAASRDGR